MLNVSTHKNELESRHQGGEGGRPGQRHLYRGLASDDVRRGRWLRAPIRLAVGVPCTDAHTPIPEWVPSHEHALHAPTGKRMIPGHSINSFRSTDNYVMYFMGVVRFLNG